MTVPMFRFSPWIELPHHYSGDLAPASIDESKKTLKLASKLRDAHMPISGKYDPSPHFAIWGFAALQSSLADSDDISHIAHQFESLQSVLSDPAAWVSWAKQSPSNGQRLRNHLNVGLYLCQHYQGRIEIWIGSRTGARYEVQLTVDPLSLTATLDQLRPSREPSLQQVEARIISVDLGRGIVCTSIGAVQVSDPDIATEALNSVGREVTLGLDFDAPPLRAQIPEIGSLS